MYKHPRFVTEAAEGEGALSDYLTEHPATAMLYPMKGPSMRNFGILEGDTLVIEKGRPPKSGDIVLAIVDDAYVLRALEFDGRRPILRSGHPNYASMIPGDSLEIRGVAVAMMRKYY